MKQTAIDYLIEQMNIQGFFGVYCTEDKIDENRKLMAQIINQAKEMEKEEIIDAYYYDPNSDDIKDDGEQYYKETYNQ